MHEKRTNRILGFTFLFMGVFFFVVGLLMIMMMGYTSALLATFSAAGTGPGPLSAGMVLGWLFAFVTFAAGLLCIVSAFIFFSKKK
ncbi:MAG: hypothetical protein AABX14_02955 [Candidatus Aenigmatarchaeota archaeon]